MQTEFIYDCTPHSVLFAYKFTGKERDAESGLDYFGARYYASSMGRWMSPDWADKPEAVPYSQLDNPQSLNLYGYVNNNPLSKADPDGHCPECAAQLIEEYGPTIEEGLERYGDKALGALGGLATAALAKASGALDSVSNTLAAHPLPAMSIDGVPLPPLQTMTNSPLAKNDASGPKAADAPGVTAGGQATDKYGNKLGPSGKPQVDQVDHSGKKGAKDAARQEGKGAPEKHPSPQKGDPHYHPTDANGEKQPTSTHHNYPN